MYIADYYNFCIRKVTVSTGIISTIAGSGVYGYSGDNVDATSASLTFPTGVAVDVSGRVILILLLSFHYDIFIPLSNIGNVYIADTNNCRIRKMTVSTGVISTIAGTGSGGYSSDGGDATSATLNYPYGVAVDSSGGIAIYCVIYFVIEFIISFPI